MPERCMPRTIRQMRSPWPSCPTFEPLFGVAATVMILPHRVGKPQGGFYDFWKLQPRQHMSESGLNLEWPASHPCHDHVPSCCDRNVARPRVRRTRVHGFENVAH
ncbi:hypothetical protein MPL3365_200194 [Mesorhizobium plurifarium]|uniref:Uncharacterized protein n=1 Tax=Mesorhizobium plurifarium TaxID=69974 RepID=A0A090G369_MESPL|nr:hypothetical protein MPL3365_200194 [Mesorhizobium plurifarium]